MSTKRNPLKTEVEGGSAAQAPVIPVTMRALVLDGTGFEHLSVRSVPTPHAGPRQLLARVDAAGVCSSILKIIDQGSRHPMLFGWDVTRHPLILGDEGSITLVEIGEQLRDRYQLGERYAIQAAVDHCPINHPDRYRANGKGIERLGVGYSLPGQLAEYTLVTEEILEGQCLLPLQDRPLPYAHAALSEPLACIISAHDHHMHLVQDTPLSPRKARKGLRPGGVTVIIGAGTMGRMHVDLALSSRPRLIISVDHHEERLEKVRSLFGGRALKLGITLQTINSNAADLKELVDAVTELRGADDVIVAAGSAKAIEAAQELPARYAVLHLFASLKKGEDIINLNTTTVHYREINVTGSAGGSPWDVARALELMAAGELDPGAHISRIGGLDQVIELLELTKARRIEGKAVVYPHRRATRIQSVPSWSAQDERAYLAEVGS
jgi:threonine dehydrogenase-like Zn-dependent dehydrogenase